MAVTDPIADMLTRIRNANRNKSKSVDIPASKIKGEILVKLKSEGFIVDFKQIPDRKQGVLRVFLKYDENNNAIIWLVII